MINFNSGHTPRNNIVLVIDESIRGDHLSINGYTRETTPFLDSFIQTGNEIHNLGLAIAGASCSYPSNALILTGARPGVDDFEATFTHPTVFQYAKAMGYKTHYMDAQSNSFWNGLTDRDLSFIDAWYKANDFGNDFNSDFRAVDMIVKIVSEGSGNFIVLNKRGAHFLYKNDYPAEAAVWFPLPTDDYAADPTFISNAYDNAILYNVNTFFERLLVNPKILENTTIVYTSDHGQTLFEKHETWLHCKHTPIETIVPMILIGKNLASIDLQYQPSHSNILPTLLDLMNVPTDQRVHSYAPSLFTGTADMSTDHFFFDGSLHLFDFPDL
jgi:glucan phosphoethanolaminetransferase (alkaline phosphatase superfamily)